MKNKFCLGFVCGALLFGTVGAFAVSYVADTNPYPVQLNGENVNIEGYQINDYTYFKLRDIADTVGGFSVDFNNDTIQLAKDGYVYDNSANVDSMDYSKYIGYFSKLGGSLGFHWILDIKSIDGNTVDFYFNYEKVGFTYSNEPAVFTSKTQAVGKGIIKHYETQNVREQTYVLDFTDDGITCTIFENDVQMNVITFSFSDKISSQEEYNVASNEISLVCYNDVGCMYAPDYGYYNNTTDLYGGCTETSSGSRLYQYGYNANEIENYVNILVANGWQSYIQPENIYYYLHGEQYVFFPQGAIVLFKDGKYITLEQDDYSGELELHVLGDMTPEESGQKNQHFIDVTFSE